MINLYEVLPKDKDLLADIIPESILSNNDNMHIASLDDEGILTGVLSYRGGPGRVDLLWLYVQPFARRQGIATELCNALLMKLQSIDVFYPVEAYFTLEEENYGLHQFFLYHPSFCCLEMDAYYRVSPKVFRASKTVRELMDNAHLEVKRFLECSTKTRNDFYKDVYNNCDGLVSADDQKDMLPELSLCVLKEDEITDAIIMKRARKNELEVSFAYSTSPNGSGLIGVFGEALRVISQKYGDCNLIINAIDRRSEKLTEHLFPEGIKRQVIMNAVSFGLVNPEVSENV